VVIYPQFGNHCFIGNITEEEVVIALRGMKNNMASGPTGLTSGMLKKLENIGVVELTRIFRDVAEEMNVLSSFHHLYQRYRHRYHKQNFQVCR
jgi:hypothetical protein